MFQEFLLKKLIKSKLGDVPDEEINRIIKIVKENPTLFQTIASEIEQKVKGGQEQMSAATEVMGKYGDELKKLS
ncbi:MAG: hypothetical protein Q7S11_02165 [bacterium]|nr:hypothetical protein [bacterium]